MRPRAPSAGRVPGQGPGSLCWPLTSGRRSGHSLDSLLPFWGTLVETHPFLAPLGG